MLQYPQGGEIQGLNQPSMTSFLLQIGAVSPYGKTTDLEKFKSQ